mgnify:FL=1
MTDLEIYIDGFNDKGIQIANVFLDVMRYKLTELGADSTDTFATVFDNSHIESEQYYMNILSDDLKPIVSNLRNAHMKDSNTASNIDYQSMVKNIIDATVIYLVLSFMFMFLLLYCSLYRIFHKRW